MSDASQELPLLRRLAVAVIESRRSGNQDTVTRLLGAWMDLTGWGGKGGSALDVDLGVALEVLGTARNTVTQDQNPILTTDGLGDRRATKRATPDRRTDARRTWLSPYFAVYREVYKAEPVGVTVGRMARTFKALELAHPREEVAIRFKHFCLSTPPRWFSVEKFCDTYPAWDKVQRNKVPGDVPDPEPGESTDAYITRLANLGF